MQELVVKERYVTRFHIQENDIAVETLLADHRFGQEPGSVLWTNIPGLVASRYDLETTALCRGGIESRPHGEHGIAIQVVPTILMPADPGTSARRFVYQHGPKYRDRLRSVDSFARVAKHGSLDVSKEHWDEFQMLDPRVVVSWSLEPSRKHRLALIMRIEFHYQVRI